LADTRFQTVYNNIGLEPEHTAWSYALVIWNLEKWNSMKWNENTSNWSNFCILLRRAGFLLYFVMMFVYEDRWLRTIAKN